MAETLLFELVSPERLLLSEQVEMVVVPGAEGNFGALPRHAPLLAMVRPGIIDVYGANRQLVHRIFVAGGYAEVTPERCTVLATEAMPLIELDRGRVETEHKGLLEELVEETDEAARKSLKGRINVAEAKLQVLAAAPGH
jgi:F-type H+-transporting ATPase subunit epsilon